MQHPQPEPQKLQPKSLKPKQKSQQVPVAAASALKRFGAGAAKHCQRTRSEGMSFRASGFCFFKDLCSGNSMLLETPMSMHPYARNVVLEGSGIRVNFRSCRQLQAERQWQVRVRGSMSCCD